MSDDLFDDGLVHGHIWASDANRPAIHDDLDDMDHDDGLVHGHAWARDDR